MKKIILTLLVFSLVLCLTACGNKSGETSQTAGVTGNEQKASAQTAAVSVHLDMDTAISNCLRCTERAYISSDGTIYCRADTGIAAYAKSAYEEDGRTLLQVNGSYYLFSDGNIYGNGSVCFKDYNIVRFFGDGLNPKSAYPNYIYAVTDTGDLVSCTTSKTGIVNTLATNVKYVATYDNRVVLTVKNDGTCELLSPINSWSRNDTRDFGDIDVSGWTDIRWAVIGASYDTTEANNEGYYAVGLKSDGTCVGAGHYPLGIENWKDIVFLCTNGTDGLFGLKSDGTTAVIAENPRGVEQYKNLIALTGTTLGVVDETKGYSVYYQQKYKPGDEQVTNVSFECIAVEKSEKGTVQLAGY